VNPAFTQQNPFESNVPVYSLHLPERSKQNYSPQPATVPQQLRLCQLSPLRAVYPSRKYTWMPTDRLRLFASNSSISKSIFNQLPEEVKAVKKEL
jgi:hypothetical protein